MDFYDTEDGVLEYEKMADGYDGRNLIIQLKKRLPSGARVLELGMGPGKDLDILLESYAAVGSDRSSLFLERYLARNPDADVLQLDAVTLATERTFDAIYSNKVLHHLAREDFTRSLKRQLEILEPNGIAFHALWYGNKVEEHAGMRFVYYNEDTLADMLPTGFSVVEHVRYTELDENDSYLVVLKKT